MRGMSTRICILVFILLTQLFVCSYANEDDWSIFESKELLINQTISSKIDLDLNSGSSLNWITANFSFLPHSESRQQVISQKFTPDISKRGSDWVQYRWSKPKSGTLTYSVTHVVRTKNEYEPVNGKVKFPVSKTDYDSSFQQYTKATDLIDINDEIRAKALELADGSTDLFEVSFQIADWVTSNIKYDLNTITADASQKATWVLETKTGVCDELSTLFMALLRSLDVPVRFVSGVSYTTSNLFEEPWNAHAWTEVYFPKHGWVPFDLTYQQFGFIDASHIKLKVSDDGDDSTTSYFWEGFKLDGVNINLHDLEFSNEIISSTGKVESDVVADVRLIEDKLGFGSYGMVELKLTNLASHYVANTFVFSTVSEVHFLENNGHVPVLLKPLQTVYVYVPFLIDSNLDSNSKYTIPISYVDLHSNRGFLQLESSSRDQRYGLADMRVLSVQEQQIGQSANELESYSLGCSTDDGTVFVNEPFNIECFVERSKDSFEVGTVTICLFSECQDVFLEKSATVTFLKQFDQIGVTQSLLTLKVDSKEKSGKFTTVVNDKANLEIRNLNAPEVVSYGESLNVTFLLKKDSFANAEDVEVRVGRVVPSVWKFGQVSLDQNMTVGFKTDQMVPGTNNFLVEVDYFDGDVVQTKQAQISVELINVPFLTKIWLYFLDLFA